MTKKAVGNAGKVYNKYTEEFRRDAVRMIETVAVSLHSNCSGWCFKTCVRIWL